MKRTRAFATVAAVVLVSFAAPELYGDVKIAFVDLQRALNETEDGRRAKGQLKRLFTKRQESLDDAQNKLKALKEQIEKQQKVLTREALQKRMEEYQKAFVDLQSTYVDYQRELAEKETQLTKQIFSKMEGILRRIGTSEGYTMIFDRGSGVVWGRTDLDLTDRLIQMYNSEAAGGGGGSKTKATKTKQP
ncbi:MAG: OmpH family outer membrane protein [Deltaproteobacteria bacterium]|nr:OmpH family outer membrane protein [Deltaproteobacteria bacterium]